MDFSADETSVNHDHSYFCSWEQATPKSNTNGSDTTLPKGKCSTACQTDLTTAEIDYLYLNWQSTGGRTRFLAKNLKTKKILKESSTLKT